jgi:hypothetical protein
MSENRFRLRFPFWLDLNKPDEAALADTIALLKEERTFVKTVRDGIRLVVDLRAGRLDVLFELFPWAKEVLQTPVATNDDDLRGQFADLKRLIMEQGGIARPQPPPGTHQFELPTFDEEDDGETVVIRRDTSTDAGMNFLNSLSALQE